MRSELMMFIGFFILIGVGMGYYTLLRIRSEMAVAYSVLTLIAVLHVCGYTCGLRTGCWVFCGLSAAGLILFLLKGKDRAGFFSPGFAALVVLFGAALLAFHGDYIQTYDDFHQWAAEVKYMLLQDRIPTGPDFVGDLNVPPESSLFVVFFQILGGYNEGHMYTAAFLLTAVAVVIPLMELRWKDWGKGVLYVLLVYAGFFTLYNQPYKSIYVDLPAAVWAGSVCMLWTLLGSSAGRMTGDRAANRAAGARATGTRIGNKASGAETAGVSTGNAAVSAGSIAEPKALSLRRRCLLVLPFLIFLPRIKWGVSFLLWAFTLGYMLVDLAMRMPSDRLRAFWKRRWAYVVGTVAVVAALLLGAWFVIGESLIPASLSGIVEALTFSSKKARLTASTLAHNLFQKSLTGNPNMPFRTVQATILIVLLFFVLATWCRNCTRKRALIAQAIYYPFCVILYAIGLYVCYVSVFSYEESVRNSTGYRYLSIVIVFGFIIFCGQLLVSMLEETQAGSSGKRRTSWPVRMGLLLCLLLVSNFNTKMIYKASSLQPWRNKNYKVIQETKDHISKIKEHITDSDRVYLLSNEFSLKEMNEYPLCVSLYYLDGQVSNYLREPWKFTEDGSISFLHETEASIEQFPAMLQGGGYTYIWVHSYDAFLQEKFRELFGCELEAEGLYEIEYREDGSMQLKLREEMESSNPHEEKKDEAEEEDK